MKEVGLKIYDYYLLAVSCIFVFNEAVSDIKTGKIKNKTLMFFIAISLPVQFFLIVKRSQGGGLFLANLFATTVFSLLLYVMGFWAAGDSKMIITTAITYPINYYWDVNIKWFPALSFLLMIISVIYTYIIIDTIINSILHWNDCWLSLNKHITKKVIVSFIKKWSVLVFLSNILHIILSQLNVHYEILMLLIFFVFMAMDKLIILAAKYWPLFITIDFIIWYIKGYNYGNILKIILATIFIFLAGRLVQTFNYKYIQREHVKAGMIISALSIKELQKITNHKFLDDKSDESLNARITNDEASEIIESKLDIIRIVRKIPMATFAALSMIIYVLVRFIYEG